MSKKELLEEGYQSDYVTHYNFITNFGWRKVEGKWQSPCGKYRYSRIYDAYHAQNLTLIQES